MTRAGRINRMIYVSDLDKEGVERLINVLIPAEQREELDYEALHTAYEGFAPSWIVQALKGVSKQSVIRTKAARPAAGDRGLRAVRQRSACGLEAAHRVRGPSQAPQLESALRQLVSQRSSRATSWTSSDNGSILVRLI